MRTNYIDAFIQVLFSLVWLLYMYYIIIIILFIKSINLLVYCKKTHGEVKK